MDLRTELDRLHKAELQYEYASNKLSRTLDGIEDRERLLVEQEAAQEVIRKAAIETQTVLAQHIGNIVSQALAAVYPNPYRLECRFVARRNTSECDLILVDEKGNEYHPLDSVGGGVADVVSTALRIAYLLLSNKRRILVLDEPAKHLSAQYRPNFSAMLRMLTADLGITTIMVTHFPEMAEVADQIFTVTQTAGVSKVEVQ